MKKTFIILITLSLFQQVCFSQADTTTAKLNHKLIISISGGTAIPEGVFSKFENINIPYISKGGNFAGGASIGYFGKLDVNYLIRKHFGVTAMLYSTVNRGKELTSEEFKPPVSLGMGGGFRTTSYTNDSKQWLTNGALIGVFAETGNKSVLFDFKICLGVQQSKSPEAHIYEEGYNWLMGITTSTYDHVQTQPSLTSYNFVGNLGIDMRVGISKKIKAKIGIDNFFSRATFVGNQTSSLDVNFSDGTNGHYEGTRDFSFTKNIFLLCLSAGLCYVIN